MIGAMALCRRSGILYSRHTYVTHSQLPAHLVYQATLMAATSFPMPPLMSKAKGYHGFSESKFLRAPSATLRPKLNEICERHATAVAGLEKKCNDYVVTAPQRAFPFNCGLWCFNPRWMEASVSV